MIVIEMLAALATVVFAVLPARGIIRRNAFVGVRTRATMRDDAAWRRAHEVAVLPTVITATTTIVAGVVLIAMGRVNDPLSVVICAIPIVVGALWSVIAASRAVH
jgi:uncharacterized membrane protein